MSSVSGPPAIFIKVVNFGREKRSARVGNRTAVGVGVYGRRELDRRLRALDLGHTSRSRKQHDGIHRSPCEGSCHQRKLWVQYPAGPATQLLAGLPRHNRIRPKPRPTVGYCCGI
jgi:hypothetical protein